MLNKDNYVPWSSRIIRYARSRPNGKMIVDSIENEPNVRRMIATPGEPDLLVPVLESFHEQIDEELTENDIKWMDVDDQAIQTILLGLPEDKVIDLSEISFMKILCLTKYGDVSLAFRLKVVEKLEICSNVFWEMFVPFEIVHKLHETMIIIFDGFFVSRRELFSFIEELCLLLLFSNVRTFHHLSNMFPYFLGCLTTIYSSIYVFRKAQ
uniref:Uncharacterized protein n=1 Tax=Tanacetum cinerariifolium TaxID=118510 RepID=A0A6L2P1M9_TANCI|nr:hypothetical protein [Tanacetum cinerariifolium]